MLLSLHVFPVTSRQHLSLVGSLHLLDLFRSEESKADKIEYISSILRDKIP